MFFSHTTLRAIFPVKIKAWMTLPLRALSPLCRAFGEPPYLEDVFSGSYVRNVDPLAVNVVAVGIPAANGDTLLSHVVAGEALLDTWWKTQLESERRLSGIYLYHVCLCRRRHQ